MEENTLDRREMLAEGLAAIVADEKTETVAPAAVVSDTPSQEDVSTQAVTESAEQKAGRTANRLRDEKGKLLPGKKDAAAQPLKADEPLLAPAPSQAVAAAPKRPTTWKKEAWTAYDKVAAGQPLTPDEARVLVSEIHRREGDFASGVSTYKQEWDSAKPLMDAIAPYQQDLQQHNIAPAEMVGRLMAGHKQLALGSPQEKLAMFERLSREYGIPAKLAVQDAQGQWQLLDASTLPRPQQPQQPQFNPKDLDRLVEEKLSQREVLQTLQQFQAEAETKYPHYETVKPDMAGLLQAGLATDYPSAYEAALRLPKHAAIFDSMQQQQREQDEAKLKAERQAVAARARSKGISPASNTTGSAMKSNGEKNSRREMLRDGLRESAGRV